MAQFINVWTADPRPFQHQCLSCGEVVFGLRGIRQHECEEKAIAPSDEKTDGDETVGDHEEPDGDLQAS